MEYKLQLEFIWDRTNKFFLTKSDFPIQNKPFKYGISITNISDTIFPGAILKNFKFRNMINKVGNMSTKEFSIPSLNPNDKTEIWIDNTTTFMNGVMWIDTDIVPNNPGDSIITFQKDKYFKQLSEYSHKNSWGEHFYIKPEAEIQQTRTNTYILILTLLALLHGVFGLNNIIIYLLKTIQDIFLYLADIIGRLV